MNRMLFAALACFLLSCQQDDVKNTYAIRGLIGLDGIVYGVDELEVQLISEDQIIATSTNPEYEFAGLEEGRSYTIIAKSSENSHHGISTTDMVMVENYLQGELDLDPFQRLAADVDRNNSITAEDPQLIRKCILSPEKMRQCFSWRYASRDYDGIGTGYVDHYTVTNLMSDLEVNFIPIKIGDVNNTIRPN